MNKLPLVFAAILVSTSALAQVGDPSNTTTTPGARDTTTTQHHDRDNKPSFSEIDEDGDGSISRAEAARHGVNDDKFRQKDRNNDGVISRQEWDQAKRDKDNKRD